MMPPFQCESKGALIMSSFKAFMMVSHENMTFLQDGSTLTPLYSMFKHVSFALIKGS